MHAGQALYDLARARTRYARRLELQVPSTTTIGQLQDQFRAWCDADSGCPVYLFCRLPGVVAEIELGDDWRLVLHPELLQSLDRIGLAPRIVYA